MAGTLERFCGDAPGNLGIGGDFQGISWGLPGDFISYGGISSKMLSVLLEFRGDFGETTYPLSVPQPGCNLGAVAVTT